MRIKLDENVPGRAARLLSAHGHEPATVIEEALGGKTDALVAAEAAAERRMVITLDRRFADLRRHPPGEHPGIVVLRPQDQGAESVARLLEAFLSQYSLDSLARCIAVVQPDGVRVRRPAPREEA